MLQTAAAPAPGEVAPIAEPAGAAEPAAEPPGAAEAAGLSDSNQLPVSTLAGPLRSLSLKRSGAELEGSEWSASSSVASMAGSPKPLSHAQERADSEGSEAASSPATPPDQRQAAAWDTAAAGEACWQRHLSLCECGVIFMCHEKTCGDQQQLHLTAGPVAVQHARSGGHAVPRQSSGLHAESVMQVSCPLNHTWHSDSPNFEGAHVGLFGDPLCHQHQAPHLGPAPCCRASGGHPHSSGEAQQRQAPASRQRASTGGGSPARGTCKGRACTSHSSARPSQLRAGQV